MSSTKKKKHSGAKKFLIVQLVILGIILAFVGYYYGSGLAGKISKLKADADKAVAESNRDTFKREETGVAYDSDGKTIAVLKKDKDVYYLTYDEIPVEVRQAIVSIEDKKFEEHHGVDFMAIVRAAFAVIRHNGEKTQGGSTITQQLARNIFLTQKKTYERKIEEIFIALDLEKKYTKHDILEFYLNNVYFGNGYYGIEAAAQGYFRKDAVDLDTSQIAFLCGLPNAPSRYDPRLHLSAAVSRRNRVLKNMHEDGVLGESDYQKAVAEKIKISKPKQYYQNYMETYVYWCATRALMDVDGFKFQYKFKDNAEKKAYQKKYYKEYSICNDRLYTGGYRIYTTLNRRVQKQLQASINDGLKGFGDKTKNGIYKTQGAGVCIDNDTGSVIAIVGGRSQKITGYTLNRAFQSYRQPGSSIKPLIVYTPALENGYTANTIVDDHKFEGGPSNAGGGYHGKIKLSEAVQRSLNTVAWQIFDKLTPKVGISYLYKMKFSNIVKTDETLASSLGGVTNGVSPLEMAKAYATIENDGSYRDPTCIDRITTADGKKVWENHRKETVVYTKEASREMVDILKGVFTTSWGTGRALKLGTMPCAGKTGTTNDYKDGWFCGFTRYYTTAIWVGNDQPVRLYGLQGASYPGHIWQNFMLKVHQNKSPIDFEKPTQVTGEIREDISTDEASQAEQDLKDQKAAENATTDTKTQSTDNSTKQNTDNSTKKTQNTTQNSTQNNSQDTGNKNQTTTNNTQNQQSTGENTQNANTNGNANQNTSQQTTDNNQNADANNENKADTSGTNNSGNQ
ncbi:MAG: PBP1A family penicillin-binding protein [Lachnospiraceae bacterium]|nr:MAG: PBP1A family penicillin-binding protein [Lachnospiraceae bacterium]